MVIMIYKELTKVLRSVQNTYGLLFLCPTPVPAACIGCLLVIAPSLLGEKSGMMFPSLSCPYSPLNLLHHLLRMFTLPWMQRYHLPGIPDNQWGFSVAHSISSNSPCFITSLSRFGQWPSGYGSSTRKGCVSTSLADHCGSSSLLSELEFGQGLLQVYFAEVIKTLWLWIYLSGEEFPFCFTDSQNQAGRKGPQEISGPNSYSRQYGISAQYGVQTRLLRPLSSEVLKTLKDGDFITSLVILVLFYCIGEILFPLHVARLAPGQELMGSSSTWRWGRTSLCNRTAQRVRAVSLTEDIPEPSGHTILCALGCWGRG